MQVVGDKLVEWSDSCRELRDKDQFGRSAFNRYYYAAFLLTRSLLVELDPKWSAPQHASIPELLRDTAKKKIYEELKIAETKGSIRNKDMHRMRNEITVPLLRLSALLAEAYEVRVVADYEPDEMVKVEQNVMSLKYYKIDTASRWPGRARAYCKTIRKVWKEAGLAKP